MDEHKNKGVIDGMKPKVAFKAGLFSGLAIMFIIGFFVLLGVLLSDKDISFGSGSGTKDNVAAGNPTPTDPGNPSITLRGVEKDDWIRGDKDADITIVEFSDIDCPFCQRFHDTMNQVIAEYDGEVNWVYRHFPLTQLHPEAYKKAEAAECVGELGGNDKFWEFLDAMFADTTEKVADLASIADNIGIDSAKFTECLDSGKYTAKVGEHSKEAQAAGGRGTPYSIIISGDNKIPINGALPLATVQAQLDGILN